MGLAFLGKLGPVGKIFAKLLNAGAAARRAVIGAGIAGVKGAVAAAGGKGLLGFLAGGALGVGGALIGSWLLHKASKALGGSG